MSYSTPPLDFYLQVRKNRIMGHSAFTMLGKNESVGTTWETLWPEGGLINWPTLASTLTVSSSSADDSSAGTGLRTVQIKGLDSTYKDVTETITLNGQTGVTITNSYYRITNLTGMTAGPMNSNQGSIYIGSGSITAGKPAIVYSVIAPNDNKSHCGRFTASYSEAYHSLYSLISASAPTIIQQFVRPPGGLFYAAGSVYVDGTFEISTKVSEQLFTGYDYELRAKALSGTSQVYSYSEFIGSDVRAG